MSQEFYSLEISNVIKETYEAHSIVFDIPEKLSTKFKYKPGQFVVIKTMIDGMEHNRPYSMSSAPYEEGLTVTIKRLKGGMVSNYLIDNAKPGQKLWVKVPEGDFYCDVQSSNKKNYYLIGAGSGITPLISMVKAILMEEQESNVFLYYGNRSEDSIIFHEDLENLYKLHSNQLSVRHILSAPKRFRKPGLMGFLAKPEIRWKGDTGHIERNELEAFISEHPLSDDNVAIICGPSGMIEQTENFFKEIGLDKKNVISESFFVENHDLPGGKIPSCKTTVHYKKEAYEVEIDDTRSILDNLLKQDVVIPFACKSGLCSSCIVKVKQGKVHSRVTKGLSKAQRDGGFILSCQSIPTTETLEIDYDTKL